MSDKPRRPAGPFSGRKTDPVAFSRQLAGMLDRLQPLVREYADKKSHENLTDAIGIQPAVQDYLKTALTHPREQIDLQFSYMSQMLDLWQETAKKFLGEESRDVISPDANDRRFRDPLWKDSAGFDFIKQSYLLTSRLMKNSVAGSQGMEPHDRAKLEFLMRQFTDFMAPTNFAFTNPEVIKAALDTGGDNFMKGMENFVSDLERGNGELKIRKTNYDLFEVGKNLAVTPGKIVFQNDLMQLIQYAPSTDTVFATPLLIVPPWINKYYILDMRPDNSFVKWAVDRGHTVFMISWVNPDERHADKTFNAYVEEGLSSALDRISAITGQASANVVGYCIGGTLLAASLACMAQKGEGARVASATFLTTLLDFTDAGDLKVFIDDEQLDALDRKMAEKGYLEGSSLRNTFSMLRANDLIWSYMVNNYMLGKDPFPFDLLYWNDDSTNMPAAMQSFYLRSMYKDNLLCRPGALTLGDTPVDLGKIDVPSYFLSTREDHIAPWKATYDGARLVGGDKTFVLAASGHVAGVVNPPDAKKYHFWINKVNPDQAGADWLDTAAQTDGSWWPHWADWLDVRSGEQVAPRHTGDGIEDAPGSYVRKKAL